MSKVDDAGGQVSVFRYHWWANLLIFGVTALVTAVTAFCFIDIAAAPSWFYFPVIVFSVMSVFLLRACLSRASVEIAADGVRARLPAMPGRRMTWTDVSKIVKVRTASGYGMHAVSIRIVPRHLTLAGKLLPNILGPIHIQQDILGWDALVDALNAAAERHGIPRAFFDVTHGPERSVEVL